MNDEQRLLTQDEAAKAVALDLVVVRLYAESELIAPSQGYDESDLAELRRARRLPSAARWVDAEWADIP